MNNRELYLLGYLFSSSDILVLMYLMGGQSEVWVSQNSIADSLGLGVRTVRRTIKKLEVSGILSVERSSINYKDGAFERDVNRYSVDSESLQKFVSICRQKKSERLLLKGREQSETPEQSLSEKSLSEQSHTVRDTQEPSPSVPLRRTSIDGLDPKLVDFIDEVDFHDSTDNTARVLRDNGFIQVLMGRTGPDYEKLTPYVLENSINSVESFQEHFQIEVSTYTPSAEDLGYSGSNDKKHLCSRVKKVFQRVNSGEICHPLVVKYFQKSEFKPLIDNPGSRESERLVASELAEMYLNGLDAIEQDIERYWCDPGQRFSFQSIGL